MCNQKHGQTSIKLGDKDSDINRIHIFMYANDSVTNKAVKSIVIVCRFLMIERSFHLLIVSLRSVVCFGIVLSVHITLFLFCLWCGGGSSTDNKVYMHISLHCALYPECVNFFQ